MRWLFALLLLSHRDQRGQGLPDWLDPRNAPKTFKELVTGIFGVGVGAAKTLAHAVEVIIETGANVLNGGLQIAGSIVGAIAQAGLNILNGGLQIAGSITGAVTQAGLSVLNGGLQIAGAITGGVVETGRNVLNGGLQIAGSVIGGITAAGNRVGSSVDDATDALKDLPADVRDKFMDLFGLFFGIDAAFADHLFATSEAFWRGELVEFDDVLASLRGMRPPPASAADRQSGTGLPGATLPPMPPARAETLVLAAIFAIGMLGTIPTMGQVLTEPMLQRFRRAHPSALLDPDDLREAYNRGIIAPQAAIDELRWQGYTEQRADFIVQLWSELPPPSDLIRMAVREAFDEVFVAQYTTDAEFPEEFAEHAAAQGYARPWARKYWRAHWELPSAEQGFEMFHRKKIEPEQLDDLLKALDYAPFWRGRLRDIAYTTPTRVDVRRMYASKVLNLEQVRRLYTDLGYAPEFADALTDWTRRTYGEDQAGARDLTRSAIEKAYKTGRISRDDAVEQLRELGYNEDEADFLIANVDVDVAEFQALAADRDVRELTQGTVLRAYREGTVGRGEAEAFLADLGYTAEGVEIMLSLQDFEVAAELTALRAKVVEAQFKGGRIAGAEARAQLAGAGMTVERADLTAQRWEAQVSEKSRELTQSQLERAMEKGLIDEVTYVGRLGALGYSDEDAAILLGLTDRLSPEGVRQLSVSTITGVYRRGVLSRDTTKERLIAAGFDAGDAELQLRAVDADLARAEQLRQQREAAAAAAAIRELTQGAIGNAYKRGVIDRAEASARLVALGFAIEDAEIILRTIDAGAADVSP